VDLLLAIRCEILVKASAKSIPKFFHMCGVCILTLVDATICGRLAADRESCMISYGENSHVPYGQRNWLAARLAICHDRRSHNKTASFWGCSILFTFAPGPFPVVLGVLVAVGKAVVEFRIIREPCLSDSRYYVEVCLGGFAQNELFRPLVRPSWSPWNLSGLDEPSTFR